MGLCPDDNLAYAPQAQFAADVLVIDDLDKAKFTERVKSEVLDVIDRHTANGKPLLVSLT